MTAGGIIKTAAYVAAIGTTAGLLYLVVRKGKTLAEAAGTAAEAINPASSNNVVARTVNAAGAAVTGDPYFSVGARVWEFLNPGLRAAERAATAPSQYTPKKSAKVFNLADYAATVDRDDAELGAAMRAYVAPPPPARFDDAEYRDPSQFILYAAP